MGFLMWVLRGGGNVGRMALGGILLGGGLVVVAEAVEIPVQRGERHGTVVGFVDMETVYREYPETKKARDDYQKEVARHKAELLERERALAELEGEIDVLKDPEPSASAPDGVTPSTATAGGEASTAERSPEGSEVPRGEEVSAPLTGRDGSAVSEPPTTSTGSVPSPGATPDMFSVPKKPSIVATKEELSKREALLAKRKGELDEARLSSAKALKEWEASRSKTIMGRLYRELVRVAGDKGVNVVVDKSAILFGEEAIDLTEDLMRRVRGLPDRSDAGGPTKP